ncbi:condensin complex subunit 2 [Megalopta genalis]|uniref:condensin complex subunit 2 n=1 Tax=Megalopta genalis TaxID=115081 RepID=UPI003FCF3081
MISSTNEKVALPNSNSLMNSSLMSLRKSILSPNVSIPILPENDDELERLDRRCEKTNDKRQSLGLGFLAKIPRPEMSNRITECIKLGTENKINVKNAFSLEIIDFMTYMIKKQDENMSNLQVATVSLDVSTKIYGYRVDSVHTEIMKLAGGLDKQVDEPVTNDTQADNSTVQEHQNDNIRKGGKKKKRRCKYQIFSTLENLKGSVEILKPTLWLVGDDDTQSAAMLNQVMLPNHANSRYHLHLYNDVIVDTVESKGKVKDGKISTPRLDICESHICPPLADFEFLNWINENETEYKETQKEKEAENRFQFDLDASVPSEEEVIQSSINLYNADLEEDSEENIERHIQKPVEVLTDFYKAITKIGLASSSEYSILQKNKNIHWAGPTHWKVRNTSKALGGSNIIETCPQGHGRKKKELELRFDNDAKKAVAAKFSLAISGRTRIKRAEDVWIESRVTLPRDLHYDIANVNKLYLHELIDLSLKNKDDLDVTHVSDGIDIYNYNNENDTSNYCPNVSITDYKADEANNEGHESDIHEKFTGNNLVAVPKLTNKVAIAYSVRAKKIDMRKLKKSIWQCMIASNNTETTDIQKEVDQETENKINEDKHFSEIYKKLPNMLSQSNAESLSFPISFVSLLHLANEKTLRLQSLPDMSDIIVAAD